MATVNSSSAESAEADERELQKVQRGGKTMESVL
jgi:hypothetical protein